MATLKTVGLSETFSRLKEQEKAQALIFWNIGKGLMSFWFDKWIGEKSLDQMLPTSDVRDPYMQVKDFIANGTWDLVKLYEYLPFDLISTIQSIPFAEDGKDKCVWMAAADGVFTTKSAWKVIYTPKPRQDLYVSIWNKFLTPSTSILIWRLIQKWVSTEDKIQKRGISFASKCYCCDHHGPGTRFRISPQVETFDHLFFNNKHSLNAWSHFYKLLHIPMPITSNVRFILCRWFMQNPLVKDAHITSILPCLVFWHIWSTRNDAVHNGARFHCKEIINRVYKSINLIGNISDHAFWKGYVHIASFFKQKVSPPSSPKVRSVIWKTPDEGFVKLNTDGSVAGDRAGGGGLIRNHKGDCVWAFQTCFVAQNSTTAEIKSLLRGLEILQNLCPKERWWVELDAMTVINILNKHEQGHWSWCHDIMRIRKIIKNRNVRFTHILREGTPLRFV